VRGTVNGTPVDYLGGLRIDEPLVRGGNEFYLADAIGSIVALANPSGAIATSYQCDPFGRSVAQGSASTNQIQYTGTSSGSTRVRPLFGAFLWSEAV